MKNKNATKYSSHFFLKINKEKRGFATSFCLVCWVIIKRWVAAVAERSFLRVVHSWFLMSVCVFLFITSTQDVRKTKIKGSSSSSLMHCHYISTWKARDPQISRHWTKTLQIPVSLMMERWTENRKGSRQQEETAPPIPSVFKFAFYKENNNNNIVHDCKAR